MMTLSAGTRLGPYEIVSPLGAGGMGEVYRARDTRLGREVAIKVLPERVAGNPELRERFEREARAVASLSHPGILAIHDFGTEGGTTFAAMELLEGETLRERLAAGPLSPRRATELALQLAQALAAAHDKGVVHRDVKPENVFLTREGRVKVLDFGLARQASSLLTDRDSVSPTLAPGTEPGTVLGTVGYMSPEQVKGQEADARADIFSFGAVLYEMLTGRRAFRGETAAETMTAILRADPPEPTSVQEGISPALERIVQHCLEKDPARRFRTAHDLAFALETASGVSSRSAVSATASVAAERSHWRWLAWAAVGLAAMAGAVQVGRLVERRHTPPASTAAAPRNLTRLTNLPGQELWPRLSPDGKTLAFVREFPPGPDNTPKADIFVQRVGGGNPVNLTADTPEYDTEPAFSPDGGRIAFRSERAGGGIFVMGSTGESVRRLTDFGQNPSWSPDGRQIVVSTISANPVARSGTGELWAVDIASGKRSRIETPGDAVQPSWSPHGQRIAYWSVDFSSGAQRDIWTVAASGPGRPVRVTNDAAVDWDPVWSPDGRYLFFSSDRGGTMNLWRVAIDESSGRTLAPPEPVTVPSEWAGYTSFAADGRAFAYASREYRTTLMRASLDPVRGTVVGSPTVVLRSSLIVYDQAASPDGAWVAFTTGRRADLFVVRADGTGFRQLTDDAFKDLAPRWSPDGQRIAFMSNREGEYQIFTIRADGSEIKRVSAIPGVAGRPVWSPDGAEIATCDLDGEGWRIDLRAPVGAAAARPLPPIDATHGFCPVSWSPDGRTLVGARTFRSKDASEQKGARPEIYVLSLESGAYRRLRDWSAPRAWLGPSHVIVETGWGVQLVDVASGATRNLLPGGQHPGVSADGRWLTWVDGSPEDDVWMATLP